MFDAIKHHPTDYLKMLFGIDNDTVYFDQNYYQKMSFWYRAFNNNITSDSHIIIRFNAFIRLFSFGHIYVHNVFINFISLLGLTALFKFFKPLFQGNSKVLFYAIFFIPSVMFWGSGLLKEGLILFGLGFLLLSVKQLFIQFKWYQIPLIIVSIVILLFTKLYVIAALALPLLGFIFYKKITLNKPSLSYFLAFVLLTLLLIILSSINHQYNPIQIIVEKQHEFLRFIQFFPTNSSFEIPALTDWVSMLKYTPNAWLSTFIRPYLWESKTPFVLLSSIENLLIIILVIGVFIYPRKQHRNTFYVIFCLIFVFTLFTIIGLMIPIFGALVRYKVPSLPFLAIALLMLIDLEKLKSKFPFLKKIL